MITHSVATYKPTRAGHLRTPSARNNVNGTPRQSVQRQGNCMKRIFGRMFQNKFVIGSMSTVQAAPQATNEPQSSGSRLRHPRAAQAATIVKTISATTTHEITRLKASCSASVVWTNKKLSSGRD